MINTQQQTFQSEQEVRDYLANRYPSVAAGDRELAANVAVYWFCSDSFTGSDTKHWMYQSMINSSYKPAGSTRSSSEDFDNYPIAGAYYGALMGEW